MHVASSVSKMLVRCSSGKKHRVVACRIKTTAEVCVADNEISISGALRAPGSAFIDRCALPKRVEGGSLSLNMAFIRWMSVET
jgi:hypothetical protein